MKPSLPLAFILCTFGALLSNALGDPYTPEYIQGNTFYYRTANSLNVNTSNGAYVRFTATESTTANSLSLYLNQNSTATSLTYGLQADDGNGNPSGTFLASGTVSVGSTAAWSTITFAEQALVAGQAYHVVIQPTTTGFANVRKLVTDGVTPQQTYGIVDDQYEWGSMIGGTTPGTASSSDVIVFALGTTSSQGMGFSLSNSSFSPFLSQNAASAQRFQFVSGESGHTALDSITLRLSVGAAENRRDVQVTLLDDADTTLATTVLDASLLTPDKSDFYTLSFDENPILTEGTYYKLALSSAESGTNSVRWVSYVSQSTNTANGINTATYQGLEGYAFAYSDATFSTLSAPQLHVDYSFSYTTAAIPEPGTAALALVGLALAVGMWRRNQG